MKKPFFLFAFLITLCSCEDTYIENERQSLNINFSKIESLKILNESSQRIAFNFLNAEEKYHFRLLVIEEFEKNNNLNQRQIALISELKDNFDSNLFLNKAESDKFIDNFLILWLEDAKKEFTFDELLQIAADPYPNEKITEINPSDRQIGECKCHEGGFFGCKKKTTIGFEGTTPVYHEERVDCDSPFACNTPTNDEGDYVLSGCGWLWSQICDGTC